VHFAPWSGCKHSKPGFGTGPQTTIVIAAMLSVPFIVRLGGHLVAVELKVLATTVLVLLIVIPVRRWTLWRNRPRGSAQCACLVCLQWLQMNRSATSEGDRISLDDAIRRRLARRIRVRTRCWKPRVWIPRQRDDRFIVALAPLVGVRRDATSAERWVLAAVEILRDGVPWEHQMLWTRREANVIVDLARLADLEVLVSPDAHDIRAVYTLWRRDNDDPTALRTARSLAS